MTLTDKWRTRLSSIHETILPLTPLGMASSDGEFSNWTDEVATVLDNSGFTLIGTGMGRIVAMPKPATDISVPRSDYEHDHPESVVIKFARRPEPDAPVHTGYRQNEAEVDVWEAVTRDMPPERFDGATETVKPIRPDWFAPVRASAGDFSWIITTGYASISNAYNDYENPTKARQHILNYAESRFLEAEFRPDLSLSNIGFKDIPVTQFHSGSPMYPRPEEIVRNDKWVIIDSGIPNW